MRNFLLFLPALLYFSTSSLAAQTDSRSELMKNYDVKHYTLDLEVSNTSAAISGNVTVLSEVVSAELDTFVIELINTTSAVNFTYMTVDSVKINQTLHSFDHSNDL